MEKTKKTIKLNKDFKRAFELMENSYKHLFITGNAGTGKSTLLDYYRKRTTKKVAILAPTGVAALNVKGQTIHSFFGFRPSVRKETVRKASKEKQKLINQIEAIVIDEISMVRADLLDCVDKSLRLNREQKNVPFGGVQMIFIGDLFQLPPVVTNQEQAMFQGEYDSPYFFSSYAMRHIDVEQIELKKIYRQQDESFVNLLNNIRTRRFTEEDIREWNKRHDPRYEPGNDDFTVHLTTTNKMAAIRNEQELKKLPGKAWKLKATASGNANEQRMPSEPVLAIKEGARVMFTCNDPQKRWVNGSIGVIKRIQKKGLSKFPLVHVELAEGKTVDVTQHTWEMHEYMLDASTGNITTETVGSYTQYPLTLAWAVTIHKAQGKTFDRILVDMGFGAFAHGQMYVALSRCTTLEGITLKKPFRAKDVILDNIVTQFVSLPKATLL